MPAYFASAVGRGIAEWIAHGTWRSLDLSPLSIARLTGDTRLTERAII